MAHFANAGTPKVVRLGANGHNYENSLDYKVDKMIVHPNFNSKRSYHDIALVKLKTSVVFSEFIKPACLWNDQSLKNSPVFAIGTGKINGKLNQQTLSLTIINLFFRNKSHQTNSTKCSRHKRVPTAVCDQKFLPTWNRSRAANVHREKQSGKQG